MKTISAGTVVFLMIASITALAADVDQGRRSAAAWCSSCHLVGPDQTNSADSAPTFEAIAETAKERNNDLRAWLADPHPPMPNFSLTRHEIDNLLAYIESLHDD